MSDNKKFITDSPKINFFLGTIIGIAVMAVIGFGVMAVQNNNGGEKVKNNDEAVAAGDQQDPTEPTINLVINDNDHILGNPDAPVKIFEFSDFQCPYCARHQTVMRKLVDEYDDKIVWIFKHFPLANHPMAMPGAMAAECAGEQGKFWEMSDAIFAGQKSLNNDSFVTFANQLGLNVEQYNACVADEKYKDKITTDYNLGVDSGVRGTPANFINGKMVPGAVPYENLKGIIDDLLK